MGERASLYFPFVLAVLFPPVGVMLGAVEWRKDRNVAVRLISVSLLAVVVWILILAL